MDTFSIVPLTMEEEMLQDDSESQDSTITDLPEEIIEYILMKVSPYNDLKSASLVCRSWHKLVQVVRKKLYQNYAQSFYTSRLVWNSLRPDAGSRITERYSHCCCYYDKSLYIFGGCTATNTTLNDLWRFDLATREWIRPLAMGTYPFPKACASLVVYEDNLVLFGGWSHPTPFPLHQAARFFSELHIYKPSINRWSHVTTLSHQAPQPTAGHSASVVRNLMVVFGGSQVPGISSNALWIFDFVQGTWRVPRVSNKKPSPRYGQSQITLDERHILIIGGCGGPNQVYSDMWLLTIGEDQWSWEEVTVLHPEWSAPQLWCHTGCKVGNMVVTLSKPAKPPKTPPSSPRVTKIRNRVWIPPRDDPARPQTSQNSHTTDQGMDDSEGDLSDLSDSSSGSQDSEEAVESGANGTAQDFKTVNPRPGLPSVRPNAMKNRQRQLEALLKYERKLRQPDSISASPSSSQGTSQSSNVKSSRTRNLASVMVLHVLDISQVLGEMKATWQELKFNNLLEAPDETIFYTLVEGRGELLMFGGIEKDIVSLQRGQSIKSHTVNNTLYTLSPVQQTL